VDNGVASSASSQQTKRQTLSFGWIIYNLLTAENRFLFLSKHSLRRPSCHPLQSVARGGHTASPPPPLYPLCQCTWISCTVVVLYICCYVHASFFQLTLDTPRYTAGHIPLLLSFCNLAFLSWVFRWSSKLTRRSSVKCFQFFTPPPVVREQPGVTKGYVRTFFVAFGIHMDWKFWNHNLISRLNAHFESTGNVCYTSYLVILLPLLWLHLFVHSFDFGLFKVSVFISDCTA
jgi:hypothetical protein